MQSNASVRTRGRPGVIRVHRRLPFGHSSKPPAHRTPTQEPIRPSQNGSRPLLFLTSVVPNGSSTLVRLLPTNRRQAAGLLPPQHPRNRLTNAGAHAPFPLKDLRLQVEPGPVAGVRPPQHRGQPRLRVWVYLKACACVVWAIKRHAAVAQRARARGRAG